MNNEITVTIKDIKGNAFSRNWKATANRIDAIRWTIQSQDVPYYIKVNEIVEVTIK